MKRVSLILLFAMLITVSISVVSAQSEVCTTVVQDALTAVQDACGETGRNQACYGNFSLEVTPREGAENFTFEQQGDIVNVTDVQTLTLNELNAEDDTWGIALMKLQANLPDTLPGQNVTFLLFGNVEIENAVEPDDDTMTPMQAFYLRTGVGENSCSEAPENGILIQTPEGAGEVFLRANDVELELGSTAFIAAAGETMKFSILEGHGAATADGERVEVPAGTWVEIPVDEDLSATGAPSQPMPYDNDELLNLPIQALPEQIVITPSLTQEEIDALHDDSGAMDGGFGFGGMDPSMFEGFDQATFCSVMSQAFSGAGMSMDDYRALINQSRAYMPADSIAELDEFLAMLDACE